MRGIPRPGILRDTLVMARARTAGGEAAPGAAKVGEVPKEMAFNGDRAHNGITSFGEDSYGNMYVTMLSSSSTGAFAWHDIYRMSHPQMKPLEMARDQVFPSGIAQNRIGPFGRPVSTI